MPRYWATDEGSKILLMIGSNFWSIKNDNNSVRICLNTQSSIETYVHTCHIEISRAIILIPNMYIIIKSIIDYDKLHLALT